MEELLSFVWEHILTPLLVGCIVAYFSYWLNRRK